MTVSSGGVCGQKKHRRRQDTRDSGRDVASFDHADIAAEVGMANKKLKFRVLVGHNSGSITAMEGPTDVTEYMVRFVCDMLETWCSGVCILKCQSEPAEIALQNAVVRTRQVETVPRNTPRYSHGSLGHCESAIKEVATATVTSFLRSCRFFFGGQTRCRDAHTVRNQS